MTGKKNKSKFVKGAFIGKRFAQCPHKTKDCKWRMNTKHEKGYDYLNGTCYLSGSFNLQCPD